MIRIIPFIVSAIPISLAINFPGVFSFLSLVFMVPIIFYIEKIQSEKNIGKDILRMFLFGFLFLFISNLWFIDAYPLDWLGFNDRVFSFFTLGSLFFIFCFISSIPISLWILFIHIFRKNNFFFNSLVGASSWAFFEYLRSFIIAISIYSNETLLGPHYTNSSLGYTVFNIPLLKELLPMGGLYLVSFVVILINYLVYGILFKLKKEKRGVFILFAVIFTTITFSFLTIKNVRASNSISKTITPTIVTTYLPSASNKYLEEYKRSIASFALNKINGEVHDSIIIFPENINPLENKLENKNNLIIGSFKNNSFYNQFFWDTKDSSIKYYEKQLLMPIGEYDIYILKYLIKLTRNEAWNDTYKNYRRVSKSSGENAFIFKKDDYYISGSICSENISPYIHRNPVSIGSNLIINILSHAPFHGSSLLTRQTIAINSTRALENGRYFITASNYDQSFIITDEGILLKTTENKGVFSFFTAEVSLKNYVTPYVKYGDYMVYLSAIFLFANIILFTKKKLRLKMFLFK
jgi:apolipoprotein N-acyltransferase